MSEHVSLGFVESVWDQSIVSTLVEYIRIPNKSPAFDAAWREHGHMHRAVALIAEWCRRQPIEGLVVEVIEHPGRTPIIWAEIPGAGPRMVREFKEYRPWKTKEQFEKEIGKYVGPKEVARLWRYVVI